MDKLKIGLLGLAVLFATLAGYESWRVHVARSTTQALMQGALAKADPEIAKLSPQRIDMFLRVEDPTFWSNDGIDFSTPGAGATTVTQGLAKNLYFTHFAPGFEKIELVLISKFALSELASKRDILTAALANEYWGNDAQGEIIGLSEAARRYYGRELSALNDDQYLSLIAMAPAPSALDPARHPAANADRVARIKRLLAHQCAPSSWTDVMLEGCAAKDG